MTKTNSNNINDIFAFTKMQISDLQKFPREYLNFKKQQYKNLKKIKSHYRTFQNTILELTEGDQEYSDRFHEINLLKEVHIDKNFREQATMTIIKVSQDMVEIEYDKEIHDLVMDYYQKNYLQEKNEKKLDAIDQKLVEDLVRDYKKMGFHLPITQRRQLKKLMKNLSEVVNKFSKNLNDYQDYILVSESEAKEIGENYLASLEKVGEKYKIDLSYPLIDPFLKYSSNRNLRKILSDKNSRKGGQISLKYLQQMVKLRINIAQILGYKNFVDFQVENRMAKNNQNIQKFLKEAKKEILPAGKKDLAELKLFAKEKLNLPKLEYFDLAYVSNKLYEFKYGLDSKVLKEYFEMNQTLEFMFQYFGEIFGFLAVEEKGLSPKMWSPDVRVIKLSDSKSKKFLGYLLLDLYPRIGKFSHMASFGTKYLTKINTLVCNFPKPSDPIPSLLSLNEAQTLFHEFGHAIHFLLGQTKHLSQNSYSFAGDIIELPSQMLEEFFFNQFVLQKLSKHYLTSQSLDKKIIQKIISAKNFQNGYHYLRQIILTELDLNIHLVKVKNKYNEYYRRFYKKYSGIEINSDSLFPAGFGHLVDYDAGYYSYLWAQIYALDVYEKFSQFINQPKELIKIGQKYKQEILEVGISRPEKNSIEKFLGRPLDFKVIKKLFL